MKQLFPVLMLIVLSVGLLSLTIKIQPVRAAATIVVPDDYSTIQAAIDAANSGDTIYVRNGIYPEHIEVNQSVTLVGESNQNTIIEAHRGSEFLIGVDIHANNTIVENFKIVAPNATDPLDIPNLVEINGLEHAGIPAPRSNDTVRNCVFVFATGFETGDADAIDVNNSINNTVTGNLITIEDAPYAGIAVVLGSTGNLIDNNTITGGWTSIAVIFADNNTVSNNYLTGQVPYVSPVDGALYLMRSSGNIVRGNTLVSNSIGLTAFGADCSVYHNNFINNTQQELTLIDSQVAFDNGYPSGGNYWSDYNGTDSFSGPYQNMTGSDGIGDTPYVINATNIDHYPLMKLWTRILGDVNGDGTVDLKDLVLMASAYGSTPGCTNWDANADLDGNGRVDLTDLVTLGMHYGQHNP